MLIVTLDSRGFSTNNPIVAKNFNTDPANTIVKVICNPPLQIEISELMNNVCSYINSFVDFDILTNHVIYNQSTQLDSNTGEQKIVEFDFQIYW